MFKKDYSKKANDRIKEHLENFDQMISQRLLGCSGSMSRINRFQADYLPQEGCVGDAEEQSAYTMFIDDLQAIRKMVAEALRETLSGQLQAEKKFAKERDFYNEQN